VLLKPDLEHCDECQRGATYRIKFRSISNVLLCHRCAVRLIVGLVGRIASNEAKRSTTGAKRTSSRPSWNERWHACQRP